MENYFDNLNSLDPLFHSLVSEKVKEIGQRENSTDFTSRDLTKDHELEILREYCVTLHMEYSNLRSLLVQNLEFLGHRGGIESRLN